MPQRDPIIIWDQKIKAADLDLAGGKGCNLSAMAQHGLRVPRFFVLTSLALAHHLDGLGVSVALNSELTRLDESRARDIILNNPIDSETLEPLIDAYVRLSGSSETPGVAVRSSGVQEDSEVASFAGQFASVLGVCSFEELQGAIRSCWASAFTDQVHSYRNGKGLSFQNSLAVVIQTQIESEKSGIAFSVHPITFDPDTVYIEASYGTGEAIVSGRTTPDAFQYDRTCHRVLARQIHAKRWMSTLDKSQPLVAVPESKRSTSTLTNDEVCEIASLAISAESIFKSPQDVEWAYDKVHLWALQARAITARAGKEANYVR